MTSNMKVPDSVDPNVDTGISLSLPLETSKNYSRNAYEPIIHEQYNRLKARLMNLIESTGRDNRQIESTKGLVKDFLNQAYFETLHNLKPYLDEYKVTDPSEGHCGGNHAALMARSLSDILVNE